MLSASITVLNVGGADAAYMTCAFRFNSLAADAVVRVESSDNLQTWSNTGMILHHRTDNPDGSVDVIYRSPQPLPLGLTPRNFTRVVVQRLP